MTYRSDHDAALARAAALEHENAALQRKLAPSLNVAPRRSRLPFIAVGVGVAVAVGGGAFVQSAGHRDTRDLLERCSRKLAHKPSLDDIDTDPHGWRLSVAPIVDTTGCRPELAHRLGDVISSSERRALEEWQTAEERLENEVSLITTYYGGDPYAADHYKSARQLWREYERAYDAREIARRNYMAVR